MNEDIYNENVVRFKLKIDELKENILTGNLKVTNKDDFDQLFYKVTSVFDEYTYIYDNIENPLSQSLFLDYLKTENEFLTQLTTLLNKVNQYYSLVPYKTDELVEKNWQAIKTILKYQDYVQKNEQKINKRMKDSFYKVIKTTEKNQKENMKTVEGIIRMPKEVSDAYNHISEIENANDSDKVRNVQEHFESLFKEAIQAVDSFYDLEDLELKKENNLELKQENLAVDEKYYASLSSLTAKIDYLKIIIQNNIEASKNGKKCVLTYNGKKVKVLRKYRTRIVQYIGRLNSLIQRYEEEVFQEQERISQEKKEEYANMYAETKTVEKCLFALGHKAKPYQNTNKVLAVASIKGEPFYILKSDLNIFNKVFVEYKEKQNNLKLFANKNDIEIVDSSFELEILQENQKKLYDKKLFLRSQGIESPELQKEIQKIDKELNKLQRGYKFAISSHLKLMFQSLNLNKKDEKFLMKIAENPEEFIQSKEYALDEKKQGFVSLFDKIRKYTSSVKENINLKIKDNLGEVKEISITEEAIKEKKIVSEVLCNQFDKMKRCFNRLPRNKKNAEKIIKSRDAKNKKALQVAIGAAALIITIPLGITGLKKSNENNLNEFQAKTSIENTISTSSLNFVSSSTFQKSIEASLNYSENESNSENQNYSIEKESFDFMEANQENASLDILTYENLQKEYMNTDAPFTIKERVVYRTAKDAANQENGVHSYFDEESLRTPVASIYEYNGTEVTVYNTEPDAEEQKRALENNGASFVGVLAVNEYSSTEGFEGFFNVENMEYTLDYESDFMERGR